MKNGPFFMSLCRCLTFVACLLFFVCNDSVGQVPQETRTFRGAHVQDFRFHSKILNRDIVYRVASPEPPPRSGTLPILWLLPGSNSGYTGWPNNVDVGKLAQRGMIVVMADSADTYWVNSAATPDQHFDDYFIRELIPDLHQHVRAADSYHNAVFGFSRGGFGAMVIALRHPEIFSFVASFSGPLELTRFEIPTRTPTDAERRNWKKFYETFGPPGSPTRTANDPFVLVLKARPIPYIYLASNYTDGMLPINQRFATELKEHGIP